MESKSRSQRIPSLVELSRRVVVQNLDTMDMDELPDLIQDDIVLAPLVLGRTIVKEFLASIALQSSVEHEEPCFDDVGRVSISTVHRSKGLEWSDVYVPYLNQGLCQWIQDLMMVQIKEGSATVRTAVPGTAIAATNLALGISKKLIPRSADQRPKNGTRTKSADSPTLLPLGQRISLCSRAFGSQFGRGRRKVR